MTEGPFRIAVGLEYVGTAFAGWQTQSELRTVQQCAELALSRIADHPVALVCAGRTDAGVHALGQVAHFDTTAERSPRSWMLGANGHLPNDVSVAWARPVPDHFHARYSAHSRTYRYVILNRGARSALAAARAALVHRPLDIERMRAGAAFLHGEQDFSAFRAADCQARSPVRRLEPLTVERSGDWVTIDATANAFLHHMVRNLAGLLIAIGTGDAAPEWAQEVLSGRDRTRGAPTAPAEGLYLHHVTYPRVFDLPDASDDGRAFFAGL
ncbi:MAG: tRNA pseudouridine(38-40) synthase TruA [Steroidobacteraceae bacterium]